MPVPPKPPERRQRRNAPGPGAQLAPTQDAWAGIPAPNAEWPAPIVEAWRAYWDSDLAATVLPTDLLALRRLYGLYTRLEKATHVLEAEPWVEGSKGQRRRNPVEATFTPLMAEIRQLEDRFGLSPLARLRLGVTLGEAARSLEDML